MKLSCSQFEGLMTFYIDGDLSKSLKIAFEEHLKECPGCAMKFKVIHSIVDDIKGAYEKIIRENYPETTDNNSDDFDKTSVLTSTDVSLMELSAYVDNELPDEGNIRVRRNIVAKPLVRNKIEKLYKLKKILTDSYDYQKNRMRVDYSKDVLRIINKEFSARQVCIHCFFFVLVVITAIILSIWTIIKIL